MIIIKKIYRGVSRSAADRPGLTAISTATCGGGEARLVTNMHACMSMHGDRPGSDSDNKDSELWGKRRDDRD